MEFIDPRTTPYVPPRSRGELPHLYKEGGHYFVTFRSADAVIAPAGRSRPPALASCIDPSILMADYDPPTDLGKCELRKAPIATIVQDALLHFEGQRCKLRAWCVMPNHVHVVFAPMPPYSVSQLLQSWKGFTARRINELLGRGGAFWERESFDRLVRSITDLGRFVDYVEMNPVKAGLCSVPKDWPYSSAGVGFEK